MILRAAVCISSYSEMAEDENTATVVHALVCVTLQAVKHISLLIILCIIVYVTNKAHLISSYSKYNSVSRHPPFIHCGNHGTLCMKSNASTDL